MLQADWKKLCVLLFPLTPLNLSLGFHGVRRGAAQFAEKAGVEVPQAQQQGGWQAVASLKQYLRENPQAIESAARKMKSLLLTAAD